MATPAPKSPPASRPPPSDPRLRGRSPPRAARQNAGASLPTTGARTEHHRADHRIGLNEPAASCRQDSSAPSHRGSYSSIIVHRVIGKTSRNPREPTGWFRVYPVYREPCRSHRNRTGHPLTYRHDALVYEPRPSPDDRVASLRRFARSCAAVSLDSSGNLRATTRKTPAGGWKRPPASSVWWRPIANGSVADVGEAPAS